jgi:hypothetical protein
MTIRLDRIQKGFGDVFIPFFPNETSVHWSYSEPSKNQLPANMVVFRVLSGPTPSLVTRARAQAFRLPLSVTFDLPSVTDGQLLSFVINQHLYKYEVTGGESVTQARDNFVNILNADEMDEFTAVANGASEIIITPKVGQNIWGLSYNSSFDVIDSTFDVNPSQVTFGRYDMTITIDCFSKAISLYEGALQYITRCVTALQRPDVSKKFFFYYGIALRERQPAIPLYELSGPNWDSRAAVDVPFSVFSADVVQEITDITNTTVSTLLIKPGGNEIESNLAIGQ